MGLYRVEGHPGGTNLGGTNFSSFPDTCRTSLMPGGVGVQALERIQQDAAAAAAAASSTGPARAQMPLPYNDGGGSGGGYAGGDTLGGARAVGWVADGGGGGEALDDVPLSLRALSRRAAAGLGQQRRIALSGRTGAEVQRWGGSGVRCRLLARAVVGA